jgi:short-subunit dehydrogenase
MRNDTLINIFAIAVLFGFCSGCATSDLGRSGERKLAGKTYVIVGASSGFARGVAIKLGEQKANVVLAARREQPLQEIATAIRTAGGKALVVTTDISDPQQVQDLADAATQAFGKVDVWMNNAGVGAIGHFSDIPLEDHSRLIDVNVKGIIYGTYAALQIFKQQGYGVIMNTGSIESEVPLAYHASYSSSKAAVRSLGQAINQELRLGGYKEIKVVTIMPWAVDTPFWRHSANYSNGTPRMAAMDPPKKVVNAMLRSSLRPRKQLPVGWKARSAYVFHRLFPNVTEKVSGNMVDRYQIETAPPTENTTGSLYQPVQEGTGVDDGVRARIKRENKMRKQNKFKDSD